MSNHYHLVIRIDKEKGRAWGDKEVARRWKQLYSWPLLVEVYLKGQGSTAEIAKAQEIIKKYWDTHNNYFGCLSISQYFSVFLSISQYFLFK